jgi:hypothetical protein
LLVDVELLQQTKAHSTQAGGVHSTREESQDRELVHEQHTRILENAIQEVTKQMSIGDQKGVLERRTCSH